MFKNKEVIKMKGLKGKIASTNPKKGFCNLILCFVIFFIIAGIGTMAKFGGRIPEIKKQIKTIENVKDETDHHYRQQENDNNDGKDIKDGNKGEHEKDHEIDWENVISLKTSDYVFIGCVIAVFWIILGIYWLYTLAYVISKSWEVGTNAWIFGVLTLVTNLFGVACLWIYIKLHHVCPQCGKLQPRRANNCALCGAAIYVKCPDCESRISVKDEYCNGCGRKMHN